MVSDFNHASDEQLRTWLAIAVLRKEGARVKALKAALRRKRMLRDRAAKFEALRQATRVEAEAGLADLAKRAGDTDAHVRSGFWWERE
ncbi:hypothetical protein [Bradyrhizobium manausense]|uniref:Uncharacterized protein n=1 Tax=Bradyrhizobium manausense TaxID=989370 RepID=A0A0R3D062_9BRAD|nr:hypothetical protein [Bradyrhizobium manausense]KRQ03259.1 hypothetical protein AOQ71_31520 [Bradyrhizobium manausense]